MHRSLSRSAVALAALLSPALAQDPAPAVPQAPTAPAEVKTVADLIAKLKEREKGVSSVQIEIKTRGAFGDQPPFQTEGTQRVLGTTHFHSSMKVTFGDDITCESETVKTPAGVMMRESDPAQGEVFVKMGPELLADLESANQALGGGEAVIGAGTDRSAGPLGSVMLSDLDKQFELTLGPVRRIGEEECWTVSGPRRAGAPDDKAFGPADHVDVVVRRADCVVIKMTQLLKGKPIVTVEIPRIVLDQPLDPASFTIAVPEKVKVLDALEHPPASAQIERVFAEAEATGWKRPSAAARVEAPRENPTPDSPPREEPPREEQPR